MLRVRQIKVPVTLDNNDYLLDRISKKLKVKKTDIKDYIIIKKSIDARDKNNVFFVYELDIDVLNEDYILKNNKNTDIIKSSKIVYTFPKAINLNKKIIIVGSGPAGLFCAYFLAEAGYKPIIIEQG